MNTITDILTFLIQVFGGLYLCVILLRFLLQSARADFYNPVSQAMVKLTNPVLVPLRKIIPGLWGVDMASLVLAILFHWLAMQLMLLVKGYGLVPPHYMLAWAMIGVAGNIITIYIVASFVLFISSFIAPFSRNPILLLVRQLLEPLMTPIRRFVPPVGGLDFSLLFVGVALYVMRILLNGIGASLHTPFPFLVGYV